jgi:phytoene dehydrogenase-like protein
LRRYDEIVIGAGVDGLVAATLLALAGRRVLIVERTDRAGGRCASHTFHPGFKSPGLLSDTAAFRPLLEQELDLGRFGFERERGAPRCVTLPGRIAGVDSPEEQGGWHAWIEKVAPVIEAFLDEPPVELLHPERAPLGSLLHRALELRRLGRESMMELLRVPPMALADWLNESFDDEAAMAALAVPALIGTWLAPRSPGSAFNLLFDQVARSAQVRGGTPALVDALLAAAAAAAVEFRYESEVERLHVAGDRVDGVILRGGETLECERVAASCNPRPLMLEMLPPGLLRWRQRRRYDAYRCRGTTAQLLLALDGIPPALEGVEFAQTAVSLDEIERAFDAVKYRTFGDAPVLWLHVASRSAPQLAPAGCAVLSVLIQYVPYGLDGGWTAQARERLGVATMRRLEDRVPGVGARVVGSQLLDPYEIERRYGLPGGQIHHGEHALDQWLVRPEPDAAAYATPLEGLWFCGGGSHPGGALTGAPGRLAAGAMMRH